MSSCIGRLRLTSKQTQRLGLKPRNHLSPLLEKCCLRVSANTSYQNAETEIAYLTGVKVGHSSLHRYVQRHDLPLPDAKQPISEVSIDGGKVRLRSDHKGQSTEWRDYKAARLQGIYYGAFFQDNLALSDWVNSQCLCFPLICLGDGHSGIWNLFGQIATQAQRQEILDWFHLKENLFKVGGSLKRLRQAESYLWQGNVDAAQQLFDNCRKKPARNFCAYLDKHRQRIVNYAYFQAEQLCSIGSGAVESGVKQIDRRLKLSGAQWKLENVNQMLALRCAYLNGALAV